ncbi:hypothetical protein HPB52_023643 [Rhipicephalus sanguineus]|uniref:Uncharacterized protein n=1 Tax=Rhipicephalus sanguineus TaxID=34632 RepID=A0A9D4T0Y6_RHISA|nr:hypothetical protein HPB52_023643 [Rhipicephalus sanguineus]
MLVLRGAVTRHPRGSTSVPAMSPHHWMPPRSLSCSGATEMQTLLAPFSAAALMAQRASHQPPPGPAGIPCGVPTAERAHDAAADFHVALSSMLSGDRLPRQLQTKESRGRSLALLITALVAFGGLLVIVLTVGRALQPRDLIADEPMATNGAWHPLVLKPAFGPAYDDTGNADLRYAMMTEHAVVVASVTAHKANHSRSKTTANLKGRSVRHRLQGCTARPRKDHRNRPEPPSSTAAVSAAENSQDSEVSSDTVLVSPVSASPKSVKRKHVRKSARRRGNGNTSRKFSYEEVTEIVGKPRHADLASYTATEASAGVEVTEWLD